MYGLECWYEKAHVMKCEIVETRMLRWRYGYSRLDRILNKVLKLELRGRLVRRNPAECDGIGMVNSIDQIPLCCLVVNGMEFNSINSFKYIFGHSLVKHMELKSIPTKI